MGHALIFVVQVLVQVLPHQPLLKNNQKVRIALILTQFYIELWNSPMIASFNYLIFLQFTHHYIALGALFSNAWMSVNFTNLRDT